ncbi:MAG TPA: helix-turn-helix domain-containing protein [Myxococcota bacterium]|nr:helix-turn-helix domain-containing protein [Myxococcota bacterium]
MKAQASHPARRRRPRSNDEISEETRARLLAAARRLFASRGFADASADEIAERAGLTRGALHYQFGDKRGLFEAVVRERCAELAARIARETMAQVPEGPAELERGCEILLDAYGEPELEALLLRDGPVVLGWALWRQVQDDAGLTALLRHALEHWVEARWIGPERVEPLARMLAGALSHAGVAIAEADDREAARARYRDEVRRLVRGLAPARAARRPARGGRR